MDTTTTTDELALRAQVTELRATLARIEGFSRGSADITPGEMDRGAYIWIAEECRKALGE